MLELGSGFNPEFTGRENVSLNASLLGLGRREIDSKFDQIAAFADIGEFMESPVKHYSSGMFARLAFAVYSSLDPQLADHRRNSFGGRREVSGKMLSPHPRIAGQRHVDSAREPFFRADHPALRTGDSAAPGPCLANGEPRQVINQYVELLFGPEKSN